MINKNSIQDLFVKAKIRKALDQFLELTQKYDEDLYQNGIMLSSRLHSLEKDKMAGIISSDNAGISQNRIGYAFTNYISELDDSWVISSTDEHITAPIIRKNNKKILFLAANPRDTQAIDLRREFEKICAKIKMGKNGDAFQLQQKWAVNIPDINQSLLDEEPNIVHFSGHGSKLGRIYLEDAAGMKKEIRPDALAELFELFSQEIECVVLNACYSETQAQEIAKHINYVIGMSDAILDKAAIVFSEAFYQAVAAGKDYEFAFKMANTTIKAFDLGKDNIPILIKKL